MHVSWCEYVYIGVSVSVSLHGTTHRLHASRLVCFTASPTKHCKHTSSTKDHPSSEYPSHLSTNNNGRGSFYGQRRGSVIEVITLKGFHIIMHSICIL